MAIETKTTELRESILTRARARNDRAASPSPKKVRFNLELQARSYKSYSSEKRDEILVEMPGKKVTVRRAKLKSASPYLFRILSDVSCSRLALPCGAAPGNYLLQSVELVQKGLDGCSDDWFTLPVYREGCALNVALLRLIDDKRVTWPIGEDARANFAVGLAGLIMDYRCSSTIVTDFKDMLLKMSTTGDPFVVHHPCHHLEIGYRLHDKDIFCEALKHCAGQVSDLAAEISALPANLQVLVYQAAGSTRRQVFTVLAEIKVDIMSREWDLSLFMAEGLIRRYLDVVIGYPLDMDHQLYKNLRELYVSVEPASLLEAVFAHNIGAIEEAITASKIMVEELAKLNGGATKITSTMRDKKTAMKRYLQIYHSDGRCRLHKQLVEEAIEWHWGRIRGQLAPLFDDRLPKTASYFTCSEFDGPFPW